MSNWTWDDLVNMRAYQPVERRAAEPGWQPHDPQDYRDRYPMAPDPSLLGMINPARSTGIGGILESPPLAGPSRGVAAVMRGENPLRATADMTGASPELWEELQARGVNPLLALGAEVAVPSMLSVIGDVSDVADVGRWAASNWDNLAPLAASLFPASRMAWNAPAGSGWSSALRRIFSDSSMWGEAGQSRTFHLADVVQENIPGVERLDDEYFRIPSRGGSIEVVEHLPGGNALEIYVNGDIDPDDLARFIDLADAGDFELITEGGSIPYEYARRLGFIEEELGGRLVREPVSTDYPMWYSDMYRRLGGDEGGELLSASGLAEGNVADELSAMVARNPDLADGHKQYWFDRITDADVNNPRDLDDIINDLTEEGVIPRIPGEDFEPRLVEPPVSGGGGGSGLVPTGGFDPGDYDPEQISDWARKIKKAQEDAIRRGSPYSLEEWMRFFDVEGVRMPTGNPSEPLRPLTRDEVAGMHALLNGSMELPVELTTEQIADLIRSELGSPINPNEVRDFDRVLTGIQDNMLMQDNAISLLRSTDVELTPRIAGNVLESFFAIRPEDIGRTGDELIEWMDSVQRAYKSAGRWSPDKPRYNVNEVLNRGLADLKILASRPTASGNAVADYDLLAAVRRMGSDADGLPRNLWDVVNDLRQIYPDVPLEQLESVAEMALL